MLAGAKLQHIIEVVVYIAINAKPNAVRGPEICKALSLPERYMEGDLQNLVHKGILKSVRGPKGGYVLAKERRNITLADIFDVVGEKDANQKQNYITAALKVAEEKYIEELAKISVESLCLKANYGNTAKPDFAI